MESWVQSRRPRTNVSCDFSTPSVYSAAPATKNWCQIIRRAAPVTQIISANLKIWCSKMQPISGNQRPHLLTSLMSMSLVLRLPRKMHLCRSSWNVPRLPSFLEMLLQHPHVLLIFDKVPPQKWSEPFVFLTFWLRNVLGATAWPFSTSQLRKVVRTWCVLYFLKFSTSQLPKGAREWCVLYILAWKCASRHNSVHFFDISTSKSGPRMVCFVYFDFEMCFAPQRRALFHLSSGQMAPHAPL